MSSTLLGHTSELNDVPPAYFVPAKVGNIQVSALLDTGSGYDIISEETARKASLPILPDTANLPLGSVDQSPLRCLGIVETFVKFSNIKIPTQAYVISGFIQDILLGRRTLEKAGVVCDGRPRGLCGKMDLLARRANVTGL